ncbi:pentapeptide repeat-containing protein [Psychromonas sp. MME2]|uniref:pentapeptide repeat-containing protein n=1 Tax=Psychromonas sp. MME2 TaxID=3231033 RepID=UPI00339BAE58
MDKLNRDIKEYYQQDFLGLDLSQQQIEEVIFENCTFTECNFSDVMVKSCKFIDCRFIKSNLSNMKILASRFADVCFQESKVIGINWAKAVWPNYSLTTSIKFQQCIINDSSFFGLTLQEMEIQGCKAHDVDFRGRFCLCKFH